MNEITLTDIVFAKSAPEVIEGNNQVITAGEKKELTLTFNAVFADFIRVEIDGKTLDGKKTIRERKKYDCDIEGR